MAVVALAIAAATLPTATESGAGGDGSFGGGSGDGGVVPTAQPPETGDVAAPVDPRLVAVVLLAAVLVLLYLLYRDPRALRRFAGLIAFLGAIVLLFWLASHIDLSATSLPGSGGPLLGEPAGDSGETTTSTPPFLLLVLVGAVMLGAVALALHNGRFEGVRGEAEAEAPATDEAADVGRAARRAADRIETTDDVGNEIYRAWHEMTILLDVPNPESSTPGEFAAAGIEAGMERAHVEELTRLFEDVRYGGDEPTDPMQQRALSVLRRIEAAYDPEGSADG